MKITTEETADVLVIHPEGRLDTVTAWEFENEVTPLIRQSGLNVLIDFGKLEYISSTGLRSILLLAKEMKKKEKKFALCCLNDTILDVFRISGFDTIISIYPTLEEGLSLS
jgi:anti-anti-sigma factor